ncbi:GNAT family N-acetyltransferase [Carbonactinospora thermoautotrophica]|uniref:GNAT family N-acetyltransferase n=1 Tax=Carbonactinospora thermoautotrophica TaxID=1469144 RepID=UPI00099E6A73|nr:GNAT family N-acetyltransferase [Carbonactinospora thermoautotrophica]
MIIRPAEPSDVQTILRWRAETAAWLRERYGTDQWAKPYPADHILATVQAGEVFMVHRDYCEDPIATITINGYADPELWTPDELTEPARYVSKLTVSRAAAGLGIGATLLDWAGSRAAAEGAQWLRLDCWTTNSRLHAYYRRQGFTHVRTVAHRDSGALFQRPARRTELPPGWVVVGAPSTADYLVDSPRADACGVVVQDRSRKEAAWQ